MAHLTVTNMGRPKKVIEPVEEVQEVEVKEDVRLHIAQLSVDFGREDLNTMGRKINEIIDYLNR